MKSANITVGLVVPVKQHEKIRKVANRSGVTVSDFLRGIIAQHVPDVGDLKPPTPNRPRKRYAARKGKERLEIKA